MENTERDFTQVEEYNQQGRVLYSMDKYEEAISYYLKAEKEDPTYIQTYFNLTESYVMLDRFDEAKKALKRAQLIDKNNGEIYFHLGNIALLEERIDEGKQNYAKAVSLGYTNPYVYMNLGSAYEDIGDLDSAFNESPGICWIGSTRARYRDLLLRPPAGLSSAGMRPGKSTERRKTEDLFGRRKECVDGTFQNSLG